MSDEQSIRDEIAQVAVNVEAPTSQSWLAFQGGENHREYVRRIAAAVMPLIRRIQAEALREAADSDDLVALGVAAESSDFDRGVDFGADEIFDALRSRADRIERGETA